MSRTLAVAALVVAATVTGCSVVPPPAPGDSPNPTVAPPAVAATTLANPERIELPTLGASAALTEVGLDASRHMEIPPVEQVGLYSHGPRPGSIGPSILAGHVNYKGVDGAFARLTELKVDDPIVITGDAGQSLTYRVTELVDFPKAQFDFATVYADTEAPELRLITCAGDVVDHHYTDNLVVKARLE